MSQAMEFLRIANTQLLHLSTFDSTSPTHIDTGTLHMCSVEAAASQKEGGLDRWLIFALTPNEADSSIPAPTEGGGEEPQTIEIDQDKISFQMPLFPTTSIFFRAPGFYVTMLHETVNLEFIEKMKIQPTLDVAPIARFGFICFRFDAVEQETAFREVLAERTKFLDITRVGDELILGGKRVRVDELNPDRSLRHSTSEIIDPSLAIVAPISQTAVIVELSAAQKLAKQKKSQRKNANRRKVGVN